MATVQQTKAELMSHLKENIGFLESSSASFDAGYLSEAKRLATTIRVLIHDTNNSKSLLGLLKFKAEMVYLNTSLTYNPDNLMGYQGLVGMRFQGNGPSYWAPLGDGSPGRSSKYIYFAEWWNQFVIVDSRGVKFTRKDLITTLANKDGGAHVDPSLDEDYAQLTRNNSVGWMISDGVTDKPMLDIELHSARQITYELMTSLKRYLAKKGIN